jgi:2-dehydro-3-deoxygluconokinase
MSVWDERRRLTQGRTWDIVAMGEAMVEYNQSEPNEPRRYWQGFGGDTSNFLVAAGRQGARVAYLSALGADGQAGQLRALWDREGVDHGEVLTFADAPTGVYFVEHGPQGHRFSFLRAGSAASRVRPGMLNLDRVQSSRAFHFSGISLAISASACDAAFEVAHAARDKGCVTSFDTNLRLSLWPLQRARALCREAMTLCDICLPSWDDITKLTGLEEPQAVLDHCLRLGARVVALKMGSEGAWIATESVRHHIPPHPCAPVDATGAGDAFGGSFVSQWLLDGDALRAGRYANVAAALSTQGFGAVDPIPKAEQVRAALQTSPA